MSNETKAAKRVAEEKAWDNAEYCLHEEVNRIGKENRERIEAAEAKERAERAERHQARVRKENRDMFLCRIFFCVAIASVIASWSVAGFIDIPFAIVGLALAVVWFFREVKSYFTFCRRWSK